MKFKKKLWALIICLSLVLSPMAASATANEPADPQDTLRTSAMTAEEDAQNASSTVEAAPEDESSSQEEVIPDDGSQTDPSDSAEENSEEDHTDDGENTGSDEADLLEAELDQENSSDE